MQCSLQDGLTPRLPHHRRVDEPLIANFQGRNLPHTLAGAPPIGEFAAGDEASLAPGYVRGLVFNLFLLSCRTFLHAFSIVKVAAETTVCTPASGLDPSLVRRAFWSNELDT